MKYRTYQGVVFPVCCDAMGHMNVQHYISAFDQALWHLTVLCGYSPSWISEKRQGWADARYEIDFRCELRAGELFGIDSQVVRMGRTSLTSRHILVRVPEAHVCAELLATSVYFDLDLRKPLPIPTAMTNLAVNMIPPTV